MCRAVLPLLSSGLDVLGAAGQAGTGQGEGIHTGCRMEAGTLIRTVGLEPSN